MLFNSQQDAETIVHWIVMGLATVLQDSELTDKQIKKLRAHDIFASLIKVLYKQRNVFVNEARVLFRTGSNKYLLTKKRNLF